MGKKMVRSMNWKKGLGGPSKCKGGKGQGKKDPVPSKGHPLRKSKGLDKKVASKEKNDEDYQEADEYDDDGDYTNSNGTDGEGESDSSSSFMENFMKEYMKRKYRKRKHNGEGSHNRRSKVPTLEGNKVLSKGKVLKTHHENVGQYSNIVCRVESFCVSVSAFDSKRKELVRRMGFGALLELDMKNIPRQFCYWLMARVWEDATMVFGEGEILPMGPKQVRCVLGIPMGSKPVPMDIGEDEDKIMLVKSMYDAYGTGPKKETISLKAASSVLCPLGTDQQPVPLLTENDEEEFMVAFMIVLLGKLLCTTTNSSNLASSLIPCVTVASHASEYDWCTFTIDWLCDTARRFQSKFMRDGYRSGCGGSLLFVMIFYLDHLHRKPVKWGVFPRVTVWNSAEIRAALVEDKVTGDEYGKLLAYDIAYGEEHPLVTRDADCLSRDGSILTDSEQMNALVTDVVDKLSKQLTPKLETLVENVIVKTFSCFVSKMTGMSIGHNLGDFGRNMTSGSTGEKDNGGGENRSIEQSANAHNGNANGNAHSGNGGTDEEPSANSLAGDNPTGVVGKLDGFIEKRLVGFVKAWKDLKNENAPGPSLTECDGIDATQRDCYRVVSPRARVGYQYVRMASVLYTKNWSAQHCMKRIMLDPSYAHFVMLGKDEYKSLGKKYCKRVLSHPVFVPVLLPETNAEHWFCLDLELKSHRIWMIDSMYEDPFSRHEAIVEMLLNALEELLHISNPLWIVGTLENWVRSVYPVRQSDTCSCGPLMLATVKHCAQSFEAELHLDTISKVRKDLFLEDVNSDFNQIRGNLENILPKERRGHRRVGSQSTS